MFRAGLVALRREPDLSVALSILALLVLIALIFGDNIDRCAIVIGLGFAGAMAGGNGG